MPKTLVHPHEKPQRVHPFRRFFAQLPNKTMVRENILQATGWTKTTFYERLVRDTPLKPTEAQAIAQVIGFDVHLIDEFQNGFAN